MEITTSKQGEVTVVALAGRFDAQSTGKVDTRLQAHFQQDGQKLLVDMDRV